MDILETYGTHRIWVNSAADWGRSHPSQLIDTRLEFLRRGHSLQEAHEVFYNNPCRFLNDRFLKHGSCFFNRLWFRWEFFHSQRFLDWRLFFDLRQFLLLLNPIGRRF